MITLWTRWLAGDEDAFEELAKRLQPRLVSILLARGIKLEDAEDVVNEALVEFYKRRPVPQCASPISYCLRIAQRLISKRISRAEKNQVRWKEKALGADQARVQKRQRDRILSADEIDYALRSLPPEICDRFIVAVLQLPRVEREVFCRLRGLEASEKEIHRGPQAT